MDAGDDVDADQPARPGADHVRHGRPSGRLHRIMAFLRDGHWPGWTTWNRTACSPEQRRHLRRLGRLRLVARAAGAGLHGHVRTRDMWGFGESQETVGVSPAMFGEFIFPYQLPLLERFGLNCYGCCEPLDKRWHSSSASRACAASRSRLGQRAAMAERLGRATSSRGSPARPTWPCPPSTRTGSPRPAGHRARHPPARLPGRGDHEGQPHDRPRPEPRSALGADRARKPAPTEPPDSSETGCPA